MSIIRPAALSVLAVAALRAQGVDVLVFAGQSNMSGNQTSVDQIPADQAAVKDANSAVQVYVPTQGTPPNQGYWLPTVAEWEPYAPYTSRDGAHWWQYYNAGDWWLGQDWAKSFGPELMCGRGIASGQARTIYVVKYSSGGKSLAWDWNPDQPDPSPTLSLYHSMTGWVNEALASLPAGSRVAGFFWMQGESDGYAQASADA
jgi:hypothetical protein